MKKNIPELDVYYIDYTPIEKEPEESTDNNKLVPRLATASLLLPITLATFVTLLTAELCKELKRFLDENRFHIIRSPEELKQFENAHGNDWVINEKKAKQRQYYIRHPKITKRNVLIESKAFHDYIENEYREEIVQYVLSHCKAKSILIDRIETSSLSALGRSNIKGADVAVGFDTHNIRGTHYKLDSKRGLGRAKKRKEYYWLDKSFMLGVDNMKKGTSIEKACKADFSFGLKAGEAKTLGLDFGRQKSYTYFVRIEC